MCTLNGLPAAQTTFARQTMYVKFFQLTALAGFFLELRIIGADYAGGTGNIAPVLTEKLGGKHHVLPRYLSGAFFDFQREMQ